MTNPQAMADYLGAKKASKEYKLHYRELVSEELQIITRTFLRQWSSNKIDFLGSRMLQSPPFLPTQTQAQMLHTSGLLFVAKLRKYMQKKTHTFWDGSLTSHCIVIIITIIVDRQYYLWFLATQLGMRRLSCGIPPTFFGREFLPQIQVQ